MRLRIVFLLSFMITAGALAAALLPADSAAPVGAYVDARPTAQPLVLARTLSACVYRIRPGDNLFRIGLRYGVSYTYLASLNGIPNPNLIYAGALLDVPCSPGVPRPVPPANCAPSQTYVVQPGDNLFRIAYNFKTDLALLRATNNMYGRVLRPRMQLTIPCPGSVQYKEVPPPSGQPPPTAQPPGPGPTQTPPPGPQILIQNGQFNQPSLVVAPGTTVTWINKDNTPYTLVSPTGGPLNSSSIPPGGAWWFTFPNVGSFDYELQSDPNVKGNVTVKLPGQ